MDTEGSRPAPLPVRLLFVDDDPALLRSVGRTLQVARPDWEVRLASSVPQALIELSERWFDVLVTDLEMPVIGGRELLRMVAHRHPELVCLVYSGHLAPCYGALPQVLRVLTKPATTSVLIGTLEFAIHAGRRKAERAVG